MSANTRERAESTMHLPAGDYWVGDPCYAFDSHEEWMALLESADYESSPTILEASAVGKRFVASRTAYGDGEYYDGEGNAFPVDAGLIGVVPKADCAEAKPFGMTLMEFDGPVDVAYDSGRIEITGGTWGVVIDTDPEYDEDEGVWG